MADERALHSFVAPRVGCGVHSRDSAGLVARGASLSSLVTCACSEGEVITIGTQQLQLAGSGAHTGVVTASDDGELFQSAYWGVVTGAAEVLSLEPGELHRQEPGQLPAGRR